MHVHSFQSIGMLDVLLHGDKSTDDRIHQRRRIEITTHPPTVMNADNNASNKGGGCDNNQHANGEGCTAEIRIASSYGTTMRTVCVRRTLPAPS